MDARMQRRIQRYGWDLAARDYEPLWQSQIEPAQRELLRLVTLEPGQRVVDIACGTGLVSLQAARAVGPAGHVVGIDLSGHMVEAARARAAEQRIANVSFERMEAEAVQLADASFDVALCALGLMYVPHPERALREMLRLLRPGGEVGLTVWGRRERCAWAAVFEIVAAEVTSDVCPLFFSLGQGDGLADLCAAANCVDIEQQRLGATLCYADGDTACDAAFLGGPVALAWSRFDLATRSRARARYLQAIEPWRSGSGYRLPGEFLIIRARAPAH